MGEPKSEAGIRRVALPNALVPLLEAHLAAYSGLGPDGYVFTRKSGLPLGRRELSDAWRQAVGVVGAPAGLRVHDLRHHAATTLSALSLLKRVRNSTALAGLLA